MNPPATQYARSGETHVAYQVVGHGPVDLVFHLGWNSHIEFQWNVPQVVRFIERLASFSRVICFDRRGHGLSDPVDLDNITLEQWMQDMEAVLNAANSDRPIVFGTGEGGPMAILHAATYPQRTSALVLVDTWACMGRRPDQPGGIPPDRLEQAIGFASAILLGKRDDTEALALFLAAPSVLRDPSGPDTARLHLRWFRHATTPAMARRLMRIAAETDVRHVLPLVQAPTLVLHRRGDFWAQPEQGRYLAEHIPGARFVELEGDDHFPWLGDQDAVLDEVEEFVTGTRPSPPSRPGRVLATVLFTDIVSSTERLAEMGDTRWRSVLDAHNALVRKELDRFDGREVGTRGDGFIAIFDGPARGVGCARSIVDGVRDLGLEVRAGLHCGEVELTQGDVAGLAVHTGARVTRLAGPGEVLVSRSVIDLVAGSELEFEERGSHVLRGVPGEWELYAVKR